MDKFNATRLVKAQGNAKAGYIYLPKHMIGKRVQIREIIDERQKTEHNTLEREENPRSRN